MAISLNFTLNFTTLHQPCYTRT